MVVCLCFGCVCLLVCCEFVGSLFCWFLWWLLAFYPLHCVGEVVLVLVCMWVGCGWVCVGFCVVGWLGSGGGGFSGFVVFLFDLCRFCNKCKRCTPRIRCAFLGYVVSLVCGVFLVVVSYFSFSLMLGFFFLLFSIFFWVFSI